jgi:transcriptional regulator with PAS, ATPase and Fis domain
VKADKGLVGFHEEGEPHIDYQFGLEREGHIGIDSTLIERLLRGGHLLEEGLIMLPLPENQFLALIRTEEPVFERKDLEFLLEATRYIEQSDHNVEDCTLHTPWPLSVVGLDKKRAECLEIAKSKYTRNSDVLLLGETGTGKEVMAKFIHEQSALSGGPFLTVNCASLPETLLYGELFGWEKGAHNMAWEMRKGYFELANGGTLFLDEIGDFPENVQVALLTAMQTRKIRRLGDKTNRGIEFGCRIIAATDRDIEKAVDAGTFRPALRKRFAFEITVPPLRDRTGEIPILANYFLDRYSSKTRGISREALQRLRQYHWPGNVRELQNVIREAALARHDVLFSWDLPLEIRHAKTVQAVKKQIQKSLRETEKERILTVLQETRCNKIEAARLLGIPRSSLYNKINKYKIPKNFGGRKEQGTGPGDEQ